MEEEKCWGVWLVRGAINKQGGWCVDTARSEGPFSRTYAEGLAKELHRFCGSAYEVRLYRKHTRESCLTRAEQAVGLEQLATAGVDPLRPSDPMNFGVDPAGYLCAASVEALAKALFFTSSIQFHVRSACDLPLESEWTHELRTAMERAWTIAEKDPSSIEAFYKKSALATATELFDLARALKAAKISKI